MRDFLEFLWRHPSGRWGLSLALLTVLAAFAAPWIAPGDPTSQDLAFRLESPTIHHWMGTDELGRDIASRIVYGGRVSVLVGLTVVLGAGALGLLVGVLAGYLGGWFDRFVNIVLINAFLSFPGILLAIGFAAVLGPGIGNVILALIITGWAGYARLARAQVLQAKEMEYVLAARSLAASDTRIILRHLLPNILPPIIVQATVGIAGAILAESTLSFLGLGVLSPKPSWGAMLNDARSHLFDAPHLVIFPALAIMIAVLAFSLFGDALRDWLDPRMRSHLAMAFLAR